MSSSVASDPVHLVHSECRVDCKSSTEECVVEYAEAVCGSPHRLGGVIVSMHWLHGMEVLRTLTGGLDLATAASVVAWWTNETHLYAASIADGVHNEE